MSGTGRTAAGPNAGARGTRWDDLPVRALALLAIAANVAGIAPALDDWSALGIVAVLLALLPLPLLAGSPDDPGAGLAGALGLAYVAGAVALWFAGGLAYLPGGLLLLAAALLGATPASRPRVLLAATLVLLAGAIAV